LTNGDAAGFPEQADSRPPAASSFFFLVRFLRMLFGFEINTRIVARSTCSPVSNNRLSRVYPPRAITSTEKRSPLRASLHPPVIQPPQGAGSPSSYFLYFISFGGLIRVSMQRTSRALLSHRFPVSSTGGVILGLLLLLFALLLSISPHHSTIVSSLHIMARSFFFPLLPR